MCFLYKYFVLQIKFVILIKNTKICQKIPLHNYPPSNGPDNISVGTRLETPEEVKLSQTGLWFRMNDKIQRLKQLVLLGKEDTVGEAVEDTYQDLSVYNIIAQIVIRGKWAK